MGIDWTIRPERAQDADRVETVLRDAFGGDEEARLVRALRARAQPFVGLVAEREEELVGYVGFSPVTLSGRQLGGLCMGMAPLAVAGAAQRQGAGSALVREGLASCRHLGARVVFALGDPAYYPRFGFQPASELGLHYGSRELDPAFFVLPLAGVVEPGPESWVYYHPVIEDR